MESRGGINTIIADAKRVITDPAGFYRDLPPTGGYGDPVVFVLVMAAIMGLLIAISALFGAGLVGAATAGLAAVVLMPIFALIACLIGAGILFVIWKLMGSQLDYQGAFRCLGYATAIYPITALLGLVPYLGTLVGVAWGSWLLINASIETHKLDPSRSYLVFGVLGVLLLMINLSSERSARQAADYMEQMEQEMGSSVEQQFEGIEDMTPEQAGRAMGEFLQGLNEAAAGMAEQQGQREAAGLPQTDTEATAATPPDTSGMTPEQAGKALGEFLKGLESATLEAQNQATAGQAEAPQGDGVDRDGR